MYRAATFEQIRVNKVGGKKIFLIYSVSDSRVNCTHIAVTTTTDLITRQQINTILEIIKTPSCIIIISAGRLMYTEATAV